MSMANQSNISYSNNKESGCYKNSHHMNRSFNMFDAMRMQNLFCDVVLIAEDIEIPAHRIVLSSCSPYFCAMFTNFVESKQDKITLQNISHDILQCLIKYIYTAEIYLTKENIQKLLPAANLLQIVDIVDACCEFLRAALHPTNCIGIRDFAHLHGCLNLLSYTEMFIERNFSNVMQCEEFLELPFQQIVQLISNDGLSVISEKKVYESVIKWIRNDVKNRETYTADLIKHVRLTLLPLEFLLEQIEKEPLISSNQSCRSHVTGTIRYHLHSDEEKKLNKTPREKPRQTDRLPKVILVATGHSKDEYAKEVECFDFKEERWYNVAEISTPRTRAGLCSLGDMVYALGGLDINGESLRTVEVYDIVSDQWTPSVNMKQERCDFGVAVLNYFIYVIGGFDNKENALNSVEKFNPSTEEWQFVAPMIMRRTSIGVGVIEGLLYVVGGYDGRYLQSIECYDPNTNKWTIVGELLTETICRGVGVLDGVLYAVGGWDGNEAYKTVETFDPETGNCNFVSSLNISRESAGVVDYCGRLYVISGFDSTSYLTSVEVYDPKIDTWTILPSSMKIGRCYTGAVIVSKAL